MAMHEELIVGLDIGTSKICAVVGELRPDGNVDIIGIGKYILGVTIIILQGEFDIDAFPLLFKGNYFFVDRDLVSVQVLYERRYAVFIIKSVLFIRSFILNRNLQTFI